MAHKVRPALLGLIKRLCCPTARVTGGGAGVDRVRKQAKFETKNARKRQRIPAVQWTLCWTAKGSGTTRFSKLSAFSIRTCTPQDMTTGFPLLQPFDSILSRNFHVRCSLYTDQAVLVNREVIHPSTEKRTYDPVRDRLRLTVECGWTTWAGFWRCSERRA